MFKIGNIVNVKKTDRLCVVSNLLVSGTGVITYIMAISFDGEYLYNLAEDFQFEAENMDAYIAIIMEAWHH